ncbi:RadC family protein [Desulforhopalus singaporensis]|uniref:DNA repair protein RadC n=1 Tax=Desulforhopalus singaporensis TaxID=91360 RepID=A0A1H0S3T1_9BACT|nr:DNA repair protein RadC [Desulforhopalus singaporensis]SDP36317.1 DNA repair protein RadC [Desulforhopalus singaporensis]
MDKKQWQQKGQGHRARLRDRFLEKGINSFSDTEVLELLLSFGTPRADCKEQARALLQKFGSFGQVLDAPLSLLQEVKGVGPKNSFALRFVQGVAQRYLRERIRGKHYLHVAADVADYLVFSMRGLKREVFTVIFLDSSHAVIESETVAEGTVNLNTIYPREIIAKALKHNAAALVVAHNHPSGSLVPSAKDITLTKTLHFLSSAMQLQLLDHLIIGDGVYSFNEKGIMDTIRKDTQKVMAALRRD